LSWLKNEISALAMKDTTNKISINVLFKLYQLKSRMLPGIAYKYLLEVSNLLSPTQGLVVYDQRKKNEFIDENMIENFVMKVIDKLLD
jgi:hypothetical protein